MAGLARNIFITHNDERGRWRRMPRGEVGSRLVNKEMCSLDILGSEQASVRLGKAGMVSLSSTVIWVRN
jgi:hypothetical protein